MIRSCCVTFAIALTTVSLFGAGWKSVGPGVDYQEFTPKAPFTYHVARIDLTSGKIRPIVSSETDRGLTVSGFASKREAIIAVNGDYFDPQMMPIGLTTGPCGPWKARSNASTRKEAVVAVTANRADILEPGEQGGAPPSWSDHALSGWPVLVRGCKALSDELPGSASFTRAPHARTAVGLSADHKTLFLVVVDGQKDGSAGVTLPDLAAFMRRRLHVCEAVNLDGGGSSAMSIQNKLVTAPTEGAERPVANHLGIILAKDYDGCPESSTLQEPSTTTAERARPPLPAP
ncbi:MAG TPA: phosphodiester glycosidase family protein [Thermoanaerobaculia bacterium]|nr:phosphodiester glycosidase family protein [Thermoanaerobaculia bacterium]